MNYLFKPFLLIGFSLLLIASYYLSPKGSELLTEQSVFSSECRVVEHPLGQACVPVEPKRIVALDPGYILDPLLSLGIKPIGTTVDYWRGKTHWGGLSPEKVKGIEIVGQPNQPSLEKLLMVKPDLILGLTDSEQSYSQLSAIAPTVLIDSSKMLRHSFKRHLNVIAQVVGQEAKAEEVLDRYQQRIETLKAQLKGRLEGKEVSVIWQSNGNFWAPIPNAGYFQILQDIGISINPIFLEENANLTSGVPFSIEVISRYDADILFICNSDHQPEAFFLKNPLISSLRAAQEQRLYIVDSRAWGAYGPSAINKLIDELSKYLLEAVQNL